MSKLSVPACLTLMVLAFLLVVLVPPLVAWLVGA